MSGSRPDKDAAAAADPVASLFSADRTMPAPVVAPEINESELTRWKSARDSLFGEAVKDAAAPALDIESPRPRKGGSGATPQGGQMPGVRTLAVAKVGEGDALETGPRRVGASPTAGANAAPPNKSGARRSPFDLMDDQEPTQVRARGPAPAAGVEPPPARRADAGLTPPAGDAARLPRVDGTGKSKTMAGAKAPGPGAAPGADAAPPARAPRPRPETGSAPVGEGGERRMSRAEKAARDAKRKRDFEAANPDAAAAAAAPAASPRRVRRGPHPAVLGALALAVIGAGVTALMFLDVLDNPFAEPAPVVMARAPRANTAAAPKPAAAAAPQAEPAAVAAAEAAQEPAEAAPAQAAAPAEVAAVADAPQPVGWGPAVREESEDEGDEVDNDSLLRAARKKLSAEDAKAAEAIARRALARDPKDHHAMEVLARALIDQDRGKEAVEYAQKMVAKRRKRVAYRLILGDALLMIGNQAGARAEWELARKLEPKNPEVKQRLR